MKEPTQADYEAGRILHQAWYNVGRAIAPPFDLIDKFDRLRWIETAKVSNAAQPPLLAQPEQEPVAKVVSTAPDRIWLDLGFDPQNEYEVIFHELHDVTWSQDNASGNGIEYVRANTTPPERSWVGLTNEDIAYAYTLEKKFAMQYVEAKLKEKNT